MANYSFSQAPVIKHSRSRFDLSHSVSTSANVGDLVPFDVQEVYAGDTFKVKTAVVSRLASQFIKPVMDNLFLDVYYFYVPSRILYDKYKNIFGENTQGPWANTVEYEVPHIPAGTASCSEKTVGDYLGLPIDGGSNLNEDISVLPFRAFAKIYDDWFRDQNNIAPMQIQTGERVDSEIFNSNAWSPNNYFGKLPKVGKLHDYFTSCLPAPQKGDAVDIPLSGFSDVNVYAAKMVNDPLPTPPYNPLVFFGETGVASVVPVLYGSGDPAKQLVGAEGTSVPPSEFWTGTPANLRAATSELSGSGFSVNDLRYAFQYQKMLERDARSGTRYVEYLQSHFGVSAGDYRLQRSEFLGGKRTPISIHQVTQTVGAGSDTSPLAEVGAYSLSNGWSRYTKGFTENGYILGVFCIRQFHSYQQGIERFWTRIKRSQFYDPVFSHIGEQPVFKTELYGFAEKGIPFGYNEAWADLRQRQAHITGQMRSGATDSYDYWHFGDNYTNAPVLSEEFINETAKYVDRTITVPSSTADQFILNFYIQNIAYRVMPTYSVPSLIDHD